VTTRRRALFVLAALPLVLAVMATAGLYGVGGGIIGVSPADISAALGGNPYETRPS
jgi:hypothetical protein